MAARPSLLLVPLVLAGLWSSPTAGVQAQQTAAAPGLATRCLVTPDDPDGDCIIGEARIDYPTLLTRPPTSFSCDDHQYPGLYADVEADCQLFHFCPSREVQQNGYTVDRPAAFLCTPGSLFNQQYGVCDHWFNVVCERAPQYYINNKLIYQSDVADNQLGDNDA